jgi:hypothetical protein
MAGPPAGFEDFLAQKYNIQKQEATNRGNLENAQAGAITGALGTENALRTAQANETNTRASTLQPLAQSSIASTQAGIGETQARTGLYGTEARVQTHNAFDPFPDLINGHIYDSLSGLNRTQSGQTSLTGGGGYSYVGRSILDVGNLPAGAISPNNKIQLNSAGTERVPGKGTGKVDTVPAMLAPGEAVLNKGAAEHMGRDNIKQLNQVGLAKMGPGVGGKGMPAPKGVQKHAQGTDMVPAAKVAPVPGFAKGTSKIPSAFYTKKDAAPLKPQALAKGTHNVMPGKSPTTPKAGPKGLANVLAAMQNAQPQTGGGMPGAMPMATAPGPRTT